MLKTDTSTPKCILPLIVIAQFCCTSLWFAGNGVMAELIDNFNLDDNVLGYLTSAVQFGFILGTFIFALYTITDRYSPSKVFFISALVSALFNLAVVFNGNTLISLIVLRFLTGFFLAGIYPVGMKIAADYFKEGLGKSLGFLVGALVLGTALPHLLRSIASLPSWNFVIYITSGLAILGGLMMLLFVADGPFRKPALKFDFSVIYKVFQNNSFKSAAFGYFGHMWELYAFWAFLPFLIKKYIVFHNADFDIALTSFSVIAVGALGCIISGYLSLKYTAKKVATIALFTSCICCLLSPLFFILEYQLLFLVFLIVWGFAVIADSPLFSTLVAQNADAEFKGTALTIVNSIGFAITIVSIQLLNILHTIMDTTYLFMVLALGPIIGLLVLLKRGRY